MSKPEDFRSRVPFPVAPVSNMEWMPMGFTRQQKAAATLIADEVDRQAKRHGMSRAQFLRTSSATLIAFGILNEVHGLDRTGGAAPMRIEGPCDDLDAAKQLLRKKTFVMDVQQHHADIDVFGSAVCFLDFGDIERPNYTVDDPECPESIGQWHYIKEIFIHSETDVGVISGLPNGLPLGPDGMAKTRDLVNRLAGGKTRAVIQAVCDPKSPPNAQTSIANMERQVKELGGLALKCYTYSDGGWRLDDEAIAYPMLQKAQDLGLTLINTHKGLPAVFAPGSPETVRTLDYPKALRDFPNLRFCAYHSGYFQSAASHPEGKDGVTEFLEMLATLSESERSRMYAEVGSTFAITLLAGADRAAHYIGSLLKALGPNNILWGTDSVWWGSPQWLIDAFKCLTIPEQLQEQFGYPALTEDVKARILGLNAAELYGVKPKRNPKQIKRNRFEKLRAQQESERETASIGVYGPQTRREFFSFLRRMPNVG